MQQDPYDIPDKQMDLKLALLAGAEAQFYQAAKLLMPALEHVIASVDGCPAQDSIKAGLGLLEEALETHVKYMALATKESCE